jgi:hypothetical protein
LLVPPDIENLATPGSHVNRQNHAFSLAPILASAPSQSGAP